MLNELQNQTCPEDLTSPSPCPKCGAATLFKEKLPDGQIETRCLANRCTYSQIGPTPPPDPLNDFKQRIAGMKGEQLAPLAEKLRHSCHSLTGRPARFAQRQLALVTAELQKRPEQPDPEPQEKAVPLPPIPQKAPPQFKTPKAYANRVKAIREHYQRKKSGILSLNPAFNLPPNRWFDTLIKTLQDEAARHDQAAHHYARIPDLASLHIEHSARAFEINRIIDMLSNHIKLVFPPELD
jgi:hypothetical protein